MQKVTLLILVQIWCFNLNAQYFNGLFNPPGFSESPFADIKSNLFERESYWNQKEGLNVSLGLTNNSSTVIVSKTTYNYPTGFNENAFT